MSVYFVLHDPLQIVCLRFFLREHKNSVVKILRTKISKDWLSIVTIVMYLLVTCFNYAILWSRCVKLTTEDGLMNDKRVWLLNKHKQRLKIRWFCLSMVHTVRSMRSLKSSIPISLFWFCISAIMVLLMEQKQDIKRQSASHLEIVQHSQICITCLLIKMNLEGIM
jgi:hypothetical protein